MYLTKRTLAAIAVILIAGIAIAWLFLRQKPEEPGPVADNNIPVVIRTNGGMLEIATISHRRSFLLSKIPTTFGIAFPYCKETATYTVDVAFTYRVKLSKRWKVLFSKGTLYLETPPPEPALPVAFDTSRLSATLDKCAFIPSMNAKDDLLRSISKTLAKDARSPRYTKIARGEESRTTIREFAQKWVLSQREYNIPANTPIDVTFSDE